MERWKKIDGYDNYSVSDMGRVRNDLKNKIRVLTLSRGYQTVVLLGKRHYVHRLVADAFLSNPHNYPEVNHINEDKTDNRVENLEYINHHKNINHGTRNERCGVSQPSKKGCIIDDIRFHSIRAAEKYFNFPQRSLHKRLNEGRVKYKGHTISYS